MQTSDYEEGLKGGSSGGIRDEGKLRLVSWNVRSINRTNKYQLREIFRLANLDVICVQESRMELPEMKGFTAENSLFASVKRGNEGRKFNAGIYLRNGINYQVVKKGVDWIAVEIIGSDSARCLIVSLYNHPGNSMEDLN